MGCRLCPRNCDVDRDNGEVGYCGVTSDMVIARYSLHMWEEPCISLENGSGTIFFSYCNMRCCFCQNIEISSFHKGRVVSVVEFSDICLKLQASGANNINLVTPTHFVSKIIEGIRLAREKGLSIPIIYNSSGYENVDTIKMLDGYVDVYLPDLKYYSDEMAVRYSNSYRYFWHASKAIDAMFRQVGDVLIEDGLIKKGVIVRHLVMPNGVEDSKKICKYLYDRYQDKIIISIMSQYTPVCECEYSELNRCITLEEYNEVIDYAYEIGIRNAFVQEGDSVGSSFIPDFNLFVGV